MEDLEVALSGIKPKSKIEEVTIPMNNRIVLCETCQRAKFVLVPVSLVRNKKKCAYCNGSEYIYQEKTNRLCKEHSLLLNPPHIC